MFKFNLQLFGDLFGGDSSSTTTTSTTPYSGQYADQLNDFYNNYLKKNLNQSATPYTGQLLALSIAVSSVGMAAPLTDLHEGDTTAEYLYWNLSININAYGYSFDAGNATANGVYVQTALDDKTVVGIETIKGSRDTTIGDAKVHGDTRFNGFKKTQNFSEQPFLLY